MFELWLVWRYMSSSSGKFFNLVTCLSILGMALGVAALVVVMSVVSGFETTLREAVVDVTGHVFVIKRYEALDPLSELEAKLKKIVPEIVSMVPFVHVEGLAAHKGRIGGIIVEGFDPEALDKTLNLRHRVVEGEFNLGTGSEPLPPVLVGRGLAEKLNIKVGEQLSIVLPKNSPTAKILGFTPRLKKFLVKGIIDLGMYEYDTRFLLTSSKAAQELGGIGTSFTGVRIKLTKADLARSASFAISSELGPGYVTRDWLESNHNLFEAIRLEKVVIFIVLLFMTVAACFNISSTLFISVLRRYGDISILRTLGARRMRLVRFFSLQGLVIGAFGSAFGLILGMSLCLIVKYTDFIYVPAEIYHLRHLPIEFRPLDLLSIAVVCFILCFISTLAPAFKGARLNPVEGLRYD
jgi:lipoprotein-releasing system permease protein